MAKNQSSYETFDSGDGPTVSDEIKKDFAHRDSESGLSSQGEDDSQGSVPSIPSKK